MYSKLCQLHMDLSHLPFKTLPKYDGPGVYYEIQYEYLLFYHGVELKAQMAWRENVSQARMSDTRKTLMVLSEQGIEKR